MWNFIQRIRTRRTSRAAHRRVTIEPLEARTLLTTFGTSEWADFSTNSGWTSQVVGDFCGDGRDDIANFHPSNGTWWVARSTGNGFVTSQWADFTTNSGWTSQVVGDFNGDGRDDIASFHPSNGTWWVARSTGSAFAVSQWADFSTNSGWTSQIVGDFDADGRDDIANFHPSNGTWSVSRSTGSGFVTTQWADFATNSGWTSQVVGDFNNDGRDDIANFHPSNGTWWVARSTGTGFFTSQWADFKTDNGWTSQVVGDFNGDGRDDIANFHPSNGTWWVARSTGSAFETNNWENFGTDSGWGSQRVGDFNNDGKHDIASFHPSNGTWWASIATDNNRYMVTDYFGGAVSDAEKVPGDDGELEPTGRAGTADDLLCWAAAASNILEWTRWGQVGGMQTTDDMFRHFQQHWTDQGSLPANAWQWWFDGTNPAEGAVGWSQVDVADGGRFFPNNDFDNLLYSNTDPGNVMNAVASFLRAGLGVTLTIYTGGAGHVVTLWGYQFGGASINDYQRIFVTDSDDSKLENSAPDLLRDYEVKLQNGSWYLQNYGGSSSWRIGGVYGLQGRDADLPLTGIPHSVTATSAMNLTRDNAQKNTYAYPSSSKPSTSLFAPMSGVRVQANDNALRNMADREDNTVTSPRTIDAHSWQESLTKKRSNPERETSLPADTATLDQVIAEMYS